MEPRRVQSQRASDAVLDRRGLHVAKEAAKVQARMPACVMYFGLRPRPRFFSSSETDIVVSGSQQRSLFAKEQKDIKRRLPSLHRAAPSLQVIGTGRTLRTATSCTTTTTLTITLDNTKNSQDGAFARLHDLEGHGAVPADRKVPAILRSTVTDRC